MFITTSDQINANLINNKNIFDFEIIKEKYLMLIRVWAKDNFIH